MADSPTPPENPFDSHEPAFESHSPGQDTDQGISRGGPNVAAKPGRAYAVLIVVAAAIIFLVYNIFSEKKPDPTPPPPTKTEVAPPPPEPIKVPVVEPVVPTPPPPPIVAPPLPNPMPLPDALSHESIDPKADAAAKAQEMARLRSTIILKDEGGGGTKSLLPGSGTLTPANSDPNSQFAANLANTKAEKVEATTISNLRRTIAQGRIIQATMESALNTDLPAPIRAIVSRDTYGEAGNVALIPKGSRLIGQYNTTLTSGQTRVFVVWTRVIRPDGVDIALGSPLVDGIGQAGVAGQLDTKFQQIFARSLMSSVMNIAMAVGTEKIAGGTTTTTTGTTGTQTSGDTATTATTNALNRLGSLTDSFIQRFINVPPTILVDQGTPVNVFINKDIVFPGDTAGVRMVD